MEERTETTATVGNGGGGGSGEKRGTVSSTPRVGKKPGDSHSFGPNDWILFDEAAPRTVQSSVSPANTGHAHLPLRTPYPPAALLALSLAPRFPRVVPLAPSPTPYRRRYPVCSLSVGRDCRSGGPLHSYQLYYLALLPLANLRARVCVRVCVVRTCGAARRGYDVIFL